MIFHFDTDYSCDTSCPGRYAGRARPEEVVWAIKKGKIVDGVPPDIKLTIDRISMSSAKQFTAYKEVKIKSCLFLQKTIILCELIFLFLHK